MAFQTPPSAVVPGSAGRLRKKFMAANLLRHARTKLWSKPAVRRAAGTPESAADDSRSARESSAPTGATRNRNDAVTADIEPSIVEPLEPMRQRPWTISITSERDGVAWR